MNKLVIDALDSLQSSVNSEDLADRALALVKTAKGEGVSVHAYSSGVDVMVDLFGPAQPYSGEGRELVERRIVMPTVLMAKVLETLVVRAGQVVIAARWLAGELRKVD